MHLFFLHVVVFAHVVTGEWIQSTQTLPRSGYNRFTAAGFDEESNAIYMLGGLSPNGRQLIQYNISTDTIIDEGDNALHSINEVSQNSAYNGWSQFYTQIGNDLVMLDPNSQAFTYGKFGQFAVFHLQTTQFYTPWPDYGTNITLQHPPDCLTSTDQYVVVVGSWWDNTQSNTNEYDGKYVQMLDHRPSVGCENEYCQCFL